MGKKQSKKSESRCRMPAWFTQFAQPIRDLGAEGLAEALAAVERDRDATRVAHVGDVPANLEEALVKWGVDKEMWRVDRVRFNAWGNVTQARLDLIPQTQGRDQFAATLLETLEAQRAADPPVLRVYDGKASGVRPVVALLSDFHFGAAPKPSSLNRPFDVAELARMCATAASKINAFSRGRPVVVGLLGDLIESFTGLNHPGSWKELTHYGMGAVIGVFELLERELLGRIDNLQVVHSVPGNHDRVTSGRELDFEREVGSMFHYLLKRTHPEVCGLYDPISVSFSVGDTCFILAHGEHGHMKLPATDIIMRYSADRNARYHVVAQGHLHSAQRRRSAILGRPTESKVVEDDGVYMRRVTVPSFFPGNFYSESLGFTSRPAFYVYSEDDNGRVDHLDLEV